jgi:uncharacterized protein
MQLSRQAIQLALLNAQGLLSTPAPSPEKDALLPCIQKMGYLQIDTIQVVARSPYLVLWSRLGAYDMDWLHQLHAEGHLFEYYAHALCFIPIEDYPLYRHMMLEDRRIWKGWQRWANKHPEIIQKVLRAVKEMGPVCSSDFNTKRIDTGWGSVKEEKIALDYLFASGALMIPYRQKFRRYYDLRERVLPDWDDSKAPSVERARRRLVLKAVQALGVAREDWVADYVYFPKREISPVLSKLAEEGHLITAVAAGWDKLAYIHPDQLESVKAAEAGTLQPCHTTLLSPFDPLISDRDRTSELFDFDYKLEAYTPVKDRKYGFFCLPILHKGQLVGRLDPKAHRKAKRLEIKNLYLEEDFEIQDDFIQALRQTLQDFMHWQGLEELTFTACDSPTLKAAFT